MQSFLHNVPIATIAASVIGRIESSVVERVGKRFFNAITNKLFKREELREFLASLRNQRDTLLDKFSK